MKSFGSRELCKCLKTLKFIPKPQSKSSHVKYGAPPGIDCPPGMRPFMVVQMGRKTYHPHTRSRYISEIKKFGFKKEEILDLL